MCIHFEPLMWKNYWIPLNEICRTCLHHWFWWDVLPASLYFPFLWKRLRFYGVHTTKSRRNPWKTNQIVRRTKSPTVTPHRHWISTAEFPLSCYTFHINGLKFGPGEWFKDNCGIGNWGKQSLTLKPTIEKRISTVSINIRILARLCIQRVSLAESNRESSGTERTNEAIDKISESGREMDANVSNKGNPIPID